MITQAEAEVIARARAAEKGWPLGSPAEVKSRRARFGKIIVSYTVSTSPRIRGTRCWITVDAETGAVIAEGYIPR